MGKVKNWIKDHCPLMRKSRIEKSKDAAGDILKSANDAVQEVVAEGRERLPNVKARCCSGEVCRCKKPFAFVAGLVSIIGIMAGVFKLKRK